MKDALNLFIQKHRDAFDAAVPGAHGWPGLERMLERLPQADALERTLMCDRILLDNQAPTEMLWARIEHELDQQSESPDLERFIQNNREAFDAEMPSGTAWENITQALPKQKAKVVHIGWTRSLMRIAASLALIPVANMGWIYVVAAFVSGGVFVAEAHRLLRLAKAGAATKVLKPMRLFHFSITYVTLLFLAVAIDPIVHLAIR